MRATGDHTALCARVMLVVLVFLVPYVIVAEWRGLVRMHFVGYDYAFFYYAFQAVLHRQAAWSQLYSVSAQQAFLASHGYPLIPYNQYVYPPQFACLLSPFGLFPYRVSLALWILVSASLYFCGLYWLACTLWPRIRRIHLLFIFMLGSMMTPFELDIGVGNINSALFAALALTFYWLYRKAKQRWAGVPLGLAILFKVTPAAVLVMLLFFRRWKTCVWAVITVVLGTVFSMFVVGVSPIVQYMRHFLEFGRTSMKNGPAPYNQSILGVLEMFQSHHWLVGAGWLPNFAYFVFSGVVALIIYRTIRRSARRDWRLDMALASLTPLLFSPLVEQAHMLFMIPTLLVLARMAQKAYAARGQAGLRQAKVLKWVVGVSVALLSLPATFAANFVANHWPKWFILHSRMFVVLLTVFLTIVWLYRMPVMTGSYIRKPHGFEH